MRGIRLGTREGGNPVFLSERARTTHLQVIGASGTGKTKFLEHLIREDILAGNGLCLIDPTGNLYHDLLRWAETQGLLDRKPILLFDPASPDWTFGFNPLDADGRTEDLSFLVDAMVAACAAVWGGEDTNQTPLLKRCLRAVFHALAEQKLTLLEAVYLVNPADPTGLRRHLTRAIDDFIVREQWEIWNATKPREFQEQFGSTMNRLLEFLAAERIRRILGQREGTIRLREVMDQGGMLLVNLSSGRALSEANASLLGALLVNDLFLKARGRPKGSRPFYLYIDECHRFVSEDVGRILDEGRQFGLHLILAHQHLAQLQKAGEAVYGAILTDARTKVVFGGLSPEEAEILADFLYMGEFDLEEAKTSLDKPVTVGHEVRWFQSESQTETRGESESVTRGRSVGTSTSESRTRSWGDTAGSSTTDSASFTPDGSFFPGGTQTWGSATGHSESRTRGGSDTVTRSRTDSASESVMHGTSTSRGETEGRSEGLVPILAELPTAVFSLEEQRHKKAAFLRDLRRQEAVVKIPERPSVAFRTARVEPGVANPERVERGKRDAFVRSSFAKPTQAVDALLRARRSSLERAASAKEAPESPDDFLE
jgi:hypothetical protein